jgi:hypothetical protein
MKPPSASGGSSRSKGRNLESLLLLVFAFLFFSACGAPVKKDFSLSPDFQPQKARDLAVINLDPQIRFSHFVEAELLKKGYRVKEGSVVGQAVKNEGLLKDGSLDPSSLAKIGNLFQVQGVVLCSVLEFNRFRDSYRLSIRCVAPDTGNTLWYAEGAKDGRKGLKSSDLLKDIVVSSLKGLPAVK